jgi:hypothetical protein
MVVAAVAFVQENQHDLETLTEMVKIVDSSEEKTGRAKLHRLLVLLLVMFHTGQSSPRDPFHYAMGQKVLADAQEMKMQHVHSWLLSVALEAGQDLGEHSVQGVLNFFLC